VIKGGCDERTRKVVDLKNEMTVIKLHESGKMVGHST
jgi:hypothetical protein